jgi:Tol biopolymer transport system component
LPDGKTFLYTVSGPEPALPGLHVAALDDLPGHRLLADQSSAIFGPSQPGGTTGHLIYIRDNKLMAQAFNSRARQFQADAVVLAEDAAFTFNPRQIAASVADDGTLTYLVAPQGLFQLTWFDRSGKDLGKLGTPQNERHVALSADQKTVASVRIEPDGNAIWLHDVARDMATRFAKPAFSPVWSPDGVRIAYESRGDLYAQDVGGGTPVALVQSLNAKTVSDWSRDGRTLVYTEIDPKTLGDIWMVSDVSAPNGVRKAVPLVCTPAQESQGRISPDGRWLAYASDESGHEEVYVQPFPAGPGKWRISTNQGREPSWRGDGKELFYVERFAARYRIMAVPVSTISRRFEAGSPKLLFDFSTSPYVLEANLFLYSPAADGSRFLANRQASDSRQTVNVITNWQQSLAGR